MGNILFGIFLFLVGVFWIGAAISVGYDAHKHGGNGPLWFLIILVTGIFGVIAYSSSHQVATQNEMVTYRVYADVKDVQTDEQTSVEMTVKTDSPSSAITKFKSECADSGYIPQKEPTVEAVID